MLIKKLLLLLFTFIQVHLQKNRFSEKPLAVVSLSSIDGYFHPNPLFELVWIINLLIINEENEKLKHIQESI